MHPTITHRCLGVKPRASDRPRDPAPKWGFPPGSWLASRSSQGVADLHVDLRHPVVLDSVGLLDELCLLLLRGVGVRTRAGGSLLLLAGALGQHLEALGNGLAQVDILRARAHLPGPLLALLLLLLGALLL